MKRAIVRYINERQLFSFNTQEELNKILNDHITALVEYLIINEDRQSGYCLLKKYLVNKDSK